MPVQDNEKLQGFNFVLELDDSDFGFNEIAFSKVSGLDSDVEVIEFRLSGRNISDIKLPGRPKYSNITLESGLASQNFADALYIWYAKFAFNGDVPDFDTFQNSWIDNYFDMMQSLLKRLEGSERQIKRKDMTLTIYDRYFATPKRRIKIKQAWPAKLTLGDFDAESGDVVVETLELAHEGWYYI